MIYFSNFHSILPEFILFISGMILLIYGAFVKNQNFSNLNVLTLFTIFIATISLFFVPDKSSTANSTFINSLREGVFVTGTGNPIIENNVFSGISFSQIGFFKIFAI